MSVIVESIPELCGHEDQSEEVEGYVEEIKNATLSYSKTLFMTFTKLFRLWKQVSSNLFVLQDYFCYHTSGPISIVLTVQQLLSLIC